MWQTPVTYFLGLFSKKNLSRQNALQAHLILGGQNF
jgi:hypothetical protein